MIDWDRYLGARTKMLQRERANAKKQANPQACRNCTEVKPVAHAALGLCGACLVYRRRNGRDRPMPVGTRQERVTAAVLDTHAARRGFAITPELVAQWRARVQSGELSQAALAREVGLSKAHMSRCLKGRHEAC